MLGCGNPLRSNSAHAMFSQSMTCSVLPVALALLLLLLRPTDNHLEQTTKRTMLENDAMAVELGYHSAASERLMAANDTLRQEAMELKRQMELATKTGGRGGV